MPTLYSDLFSEEFEAVLREYLAEANPAAKESLRNDIVAHCLPYVQKIARGLARRSTDPVDDLIQVGSMGLIKALEKYNPLAGSSFKTYATYLITGEIRHYLRDKSSIIKAPRQMYELYYRVNQIAQRLTEDLGRAPSDLEIAEELQCPVERIRDMDLVDRRRILYSLDQFVLHPDGGNGETLYVERLVDNRYHAFLQNQEDKLVLERALGTLKEELRCVVKMTYYDDMSQMEIAKVLGISQMQVSRRLRKALEQLHGALHAEHAERV